MVRFSKRGTEEGVLGWSEVLRLGEVEDGTDRQTLLGDSAEGNFDLVDLSEVHSIVRVPSMHN